MDFVKTMSVFLKENKVTNFFSIIVLETFVSIQTDSLQSIT